MWVRWTKWSVVLCLQKQNRREVMDSGVHLQRKKKMQTVDFLQNRECSIFCLDNRIKGSIGCVASIAHSLFHATHSSQAFQLCLHRYIPLMFLSRNFKQKKLKSFVFLYIYISIITTTIIIIIIICLVLFFFCMQV
jgi:hypothetical protein